MKAYNRDYNTSIKISHMIITLGTDSIYSFFPKTFSTVDNQARSRMIVERDALRINITLRGVDGCLVIVMHSDHVLLA